MDHRASLAASLQRPRPPQRAVSSGAGSYGGLTQQQQQLPKRPTLPSRLSNVRSASQPTNVVDLTLDTSGGNREAFLGNREKIVESPDVIDLEDGDDGEPPAKRAKTMGDAFRADGVEMVANENDKAHEIAPGSPLPSLPKTKSSIIRLTGTRRHRFGIDAIARRAHGLDAPALATRAPPPKKVLDFSPWTGNHPEDVLSETVIKAGYFEKSQGTNQIESNSAKANVWPNLSAKNHAGLSMLSYLYTAVMEKRQIMGRCTTPSTFKPPPRVVVTDTKREAWLRDLANPDVPLRKQSRTIPHGIRGKLLMEQCLSKDIPLQRAVWLAKCVGANELRAARRKGVSRSAAADNEAKWVREWTVHVEKFLEGVIALCGQLDWQQKVDYAVKLATAFYADTLLDTDHFLDWIVSSFTEAPSERLPIWIVLVQIYWKGITMYGRRGRRLAEGTLEHLQRVTETKLEVNMLLRARLQKVIAILAVTGRGCLIIPRTWEKYNHLLTPQADATTGAYMAETLARNIMKRNERLAAPLCKTAAKTRSAVLDLYIELDSIGCDVDIEKLTTRCQELVSEPSKLVRAVLDWASTPYRAGIARVYLAAAILAHLRGSGYDVDAVVLQYIGDAKALPASSVDNGHRVIVELVRLEAFSVGRYLQWLITSGVLSSSNGELTCATSLISALPMTGLPLYVLNTRKTLMRRLGFPLDEHEAVAEVLASIDEAIARSATEHAELIDIPRDLTMSARFNISRQTCVKVSTMVKEAGIGVRGFGVARDVIERTHDIASLATLVSAASTTDNGALLATVTDTVNLHAESLAALGEFKCLVRGLTEQYLTLRSQQPPDRTFILALIGLTRRIPEKTSFPKLLKDDRVICEQQNALTACSPASDNLIGMQATSLDSDGDIDAVFASGNTMDEQLMHRVFMRIMQRATKPQAARPDESASRVGGWLNQLRSVDASGGFDRLVQDYLRTMFKDTSGDAFSSRGITSLVSGGCVPLGTVADAAKDITAPQVAAIVLLTFLSLDVAASAGLSESEKYRYCLQQELCKAEHIDSLLTLVRTACDTADLLIDDPDIFQFLIWCVQIKPGSIRSTFEGGSYSSALQMNASRLITTILRRGNAAICEAKDLNLRSIVRCADSLSVRYSVGALRYFTPDTSSSTTKQEDETVLADAIRESFSSCSDVWPQLVEFAPVATNRSLHEWAQEKLLAMAMDNSNAESDDADGQMQRYLDLLASTSTAANQSDSSGIVATITGMLKDLEKRLSDLDGFDTDAQHDLAGAFRQLPVLLHLCVEHVHALPDESEALRQARYNLLSILCALLAHTRLQARQDLVEYVFDLASTLSDNLPEMSLASLKLPSSTSSKIASDARIISILGSDVSAKDNTWLALASQSLPMGSQQQRALNKHPSQQQSSSQIGGARPQASGPSSQQSPHQQQHPPRAWPLQAGPGLSLRQDSRVPAFETKMTPFPLRRWEIMPDPTPVMGENDASLSLGLFGARKV